MLNSYQSPLLNKNLCIRLFYTWTRIDVRSDSLNYFIQSIYHLQIFGMILTLFIVNQSEQIGALNLIQYTTSKINRYLFLLDFDSNEGVTAEMTVVFLAYVIIMGCFVGINTYNSLKGQHRGTFANKYLSNYVDIDNRILRFIFNNLCLSLIKCYLHGAMHVSPSPTFSTFIFVIAIALYIVQNILFLYFTCFCSPTLLSEDLFSSQNHQNYHLTQIHKLVLPIIIVCSKSSNTIRWVAIILNFIFCCSQTLSFLWFLPYYNVRFLRLTNKFNFIIATLSIMLPVYETLVSSSNEDLLSSLVLTTWILLVPFLVTVSDNILNIILRKATFGSPTILRPELLVQKLSMFEWITNHRALRHEKQKRYDIADFYYQTMLYKKDDLFISAKAANSKNEVLETIITRFLDWSVGRFPKNSALKILLVGWLFEKQKNTSKAILILNELRKDRRNGLEDMSTLLLQMSIHSELKRRSSEDKLNLLQYLQNTDGLVLLQKEMTKQAQLHESFWNEYKEDYPFAYKLLKIEEEISGQRRVVCKIWEKYQSIIPRSYTAPYILYGHYIGSLENNAYEAAKILERARMQSQRQKMANKVSEISDQNIYDEDIILITVSGLPKSFGRIENCVQGVSYFGYQQTSLQQKDLSLLMSPFYTEIYASLSSQRIDIEIDQAPAPLLQDFVKKSNGTICSISQTMKIHPDIQHELKYTLLLKPIAHETSYMLIQEDGLIDSFTERVQDLLGLPTTGLVKSTEICPELDSINTAINNFATTVINKNNYQTSEERFISTPHQRIKSQEKILSKRFLGEGDVLEFYHYSSLRKAENKMEPKRIKIHCKVEIKFYGQKFIKIIRMQPVANINLYRDQLYLATPNPELASPTNSLRLNALNQEDKSEDSSYLVEAEEREKEFQSPEIHQEKYAFFMSLGSEINLISPKSCYLPSPKKTTFFEVEKRPSTNEQILLSSEPLTTSDRRNTMKTRETQVAIVNHSKMIGVSNTSTTISNNKRVESNIRNAIETKVSKSFYQVYSRTLYICVILIFIVQQIQNSYVMNTLSIYDSNKQVVLTVNQRSQNLLDMNQDLFNLQQISSLLIAEAGNPSTSLKNTKNQYLAQTNLHTAKLKNLNAQFKQSAKTLGTRSSLLNRNGVRLSNFPLQSSDLALNEQNATTYVAVNIILAEVDKITHSYTGDLKNMMSLLPHFQFITLNSLNDVLVVSEGDIDLVQETSAYIKSEKSILNNMLLIPSLVLFMCSIGLTIWVIEKKLQHQNRTLQSWMIISPTHVATVQNMIFRFKGNIKRGGANFENMKFSELNTKSHMYRRTLKTLKVTYTRRTIYKNLIAVFCVTSVIYLHALLYYGLSITNFTDLQLLHEKITLAARIQLVVRTDMINTYSVIHSNSSAFMRNQPVLEEASVILDEIKEFQVKIPKVFNYANSDAQNLEVNNLVFYNSCDLLGDLMASCQEISAASNSFGIISWLSLIESRTADLINRYSSSAKTDSDLQDIGATILPILRDPTDILESLLDHLLQKLDQVFQTKQQTFMNTRVTIIYVTIILDMSLLILLWNYVVKRFTESEVRLKRLLKLIPKELILDNKVFVSYLNKSSGDAVSLHPSNI